MAKAQNELQNVLADVRRGIWQPSRPPVVEAPRILARAIEDANRQLAKADAESLPERLTPHSLRRTFASVLFAIGEAPPYVMAQLRHATPSLTLAIYARQMDRRDGEPERLKALVEGHEWAPMGTSGDLRARETVAAANGTVRESAL